MTQSWIICFYPVWLLSQMQSGVRRRGTYNHFLQRLPSLLRCYEQLGYGYARHFFTISATYTSVPDDKCLVVSLESLPDTKTYYTLDGSQPTKGAFLYENPLRIDKVVY